ncbi:TOBE domain-containing protein [Pseudomonas sp. 2FG]|uniref:TOBE domain-containing protein n=1 Tax=Pseudomonas sp. 2FG TaxID=2502191 RepID=UPI0010F6ACD2
MALYSQLHSGTQAGRSATAVVTQASCEVLGLMPGRRACAFFKASSVILASDA